MDLILLLTAPGKHQELATEASLYSHVKHLGLQGQRVTTVGPKGDLDMPIDSPRLLNKALWFALNDSKLTDTFILSENSTFLTGEYDPAPHRCLQHSGHMKRKGAWTSAMVGTIQYLLEEGYPTYDYETRRPVIINKAEMSLAMTPMFGGIYFPRTMYFNTNFKEPERVEEVSLEKWTHGMTVPSPVVSLDDTCFAHPECIKWIQKSYGLSPTRRK